MRIASQESCYSQSISGFIYNLLQTPLFNDQKSVTDVSTSVPHHTFCIKLSVNNPNWHRVQAGEVCWWLRTSWGSPRGSQTSCGTVTEAGGISLWQGLLWPQKETFGLRAFGGSLAFRATSAMSVTWRAQKVPLWSSVPITDSSSALPWVSRALRVTPPPWTLTPCSARLFLLSILSNNKDTRGIYFYLQPANETIQWKGAPACLNLLRPLIASHCPNSQHLLHK